MALNFPSNPSENDIYQFGLLTYIFKNGKWVSQSRGASQLPWYSNELNHRAMWERLCAEAGLVLVAGSFEEGGTINATNEVLWWKTGASIFAWGTNEAKTVPANSTPATFGGIGVGAWVDRTDVTLRSELSADDVSISELSKLRKHVYSPSLAQATLDLSSYKKSILNTSETITTPFSIPSMSELGGEGMKMGLIGTSTSYSTNAITKSGNVTVDLSNQDSNVGSATVDCIMYIDPSWPNSTVYPQRAYVHDLALIGDSSSNNEAAIYVLQGGGYTFERISSINCERAIWAKDMWLTQVNECQTFGAFEIDGGTSITLNNCWAKGNTEVVGAYHFESVLYSTLNACASDATPNTAYYFNNSTITLNGCGCESSTTVTPDSGTALAIDSNNNLVINNFVCVPKTVDTRIALITVGDSNRVEIHGWNSSYGGENSLDFYIYGNGSIVEIWGSKFYGGRSPLVQFAVGSTSKVVYHNMSGNTTIYYANTVPGPALSEVDFSYGTWTPVINFGGATTGIKYTTQTGTWYKNGNQAIMSFSIQLSSVGTATGIVTLTGLPFISYGSEGVEFSLLRNIVGGPLVGVIDASSNIMVIDVRSNTGNTNATNSNFTSTTELRGTIRVSIIGSKFSGK